MIKIAIVLFCVTLASTLKENGKTCDCRYRLQDTAGQSFGNASYTTVETKCDDGFDAICSGHCAKEFAILKFDGGWKKKMGKKLFGDLVCEFEGKDFMNMFGTIDWQFCGKGWHGTDLLTSPLCCKNLTMIPCYKLN